MVGNELTNMCTRKFLVNCLRSHFWINWGVEHDFVILSFSKFEYFGINGQKRALILDLFGL